MAFTHGDRYKPLPGYKTMATHFHTAFTQELIESGNLDTTPPWIPMMRALGINIAHIFDFHGDGHPNDPGPLRLPELENYFAASLRHSNEDFLIRPCKLKAVVGDQILPIDKVTGDPRGHHASKKIEISLKKEIELRPDEEIEVELLGFDEANV